MKLGPSFFVEYSPCGKWLASCGERSVGVRSARVSKPRITSKLSYGSGGAFSPDSSALLIKTTSGELFSIHLKDENPAFRKLRETAGEGATPLFSDCGSYVVDGSWDGNLTVINAKSGELLFQRQFPEMIAAVLCDASRKHWFVHHSPKAESDECMPEPDFFTAWSFPETTDFSRVITPGHRFVSSAAISPSGKLLALVHGAPPNVLSVIETDTGETIASTTIDAGGTGSNLAWSVVGKLGVVEENFVRFYSDSLKFLGEHSTPYACDLSFSPDGETVAIGSWEVGETALLRDVF